MIGFRLPRDETKNNTSDRYAGGSLHKPDLGHAGGTLHEKDVGHAGGTLHEQDVGHTGGTLYEPDVGMLVASSSSRM